MFYLNCAFLKYRVKLKAVFCQLKSQRNAVARLLRQNLFVLTFGLTASVTGGTALARTVENKASSLPPPEQSESDKQRKTKKV